MRTLQNINRAMLAVALIVSLSAAGCGGSLARRPVDSDVPVVTAGRCGGDSEHARRHAETGVERHPQDAPRQVLNASANNPAEFSLCMAKHGIRMSSTTPSSPRCVEHASTPPCSRNAWSERAMSV